jgi:glycosyltransferase involved in cell wall biosynthesis
MMDFNPGYSLTGIIKDQSRMLVRYGHEVHLFTNEQFNKGDLADFSHCTVHQKIPFAHLIDYSSAKDISDDHKETILKTKDMLIEELADIDIIYTHDFVFTGWFLPYGLGCLAAAKELPNSRWMHWIHSVPSSLRDWWNVKEFGRQHKLVFPNITDKRRVAEQFRGWDDDVRIIPHIKDLRTWFDFSSDTKKLIDTMPSVMSSNIMQVLPAGTDRLSAKGVDKVIKIFGALKATGSRVCLLIANQWATGRQRKECIEPYENLAKSVGLESGKDFAFTSDLHEDWANGLPKHMVCELFQCSNLFIFPTREESFGLVVPEASLSGGCLLVLNRSLAMQAEISGNQALYVDFGSFTNEFRPPNENKYLWDVAAIIRKRLQENESCSTKMFFKNFNNMDYLYNQYYQPTMCEARLWV